MLEDLTPREREIFDLLLERVSPKEIARKLNISDHTVAFHRTKLYNKLDVQNIKELFAKYSTNGKTPPPEALEAEATAAVSMSNKLSAHSAPKGEIIDVHNLGFFASSDMKFGGKSTSEVFITNEKIDGKTIDNALNIKTNLIRKDTNEIWAQAFTHRNDIIQRLRKANGIRFKALGDGKTWAIEFHTTESTPERKYACYTYMLGTTHDQVIVVDIPYSNLYLPIWWEKYSFDFYKERIVGLAFTAQNLQYEGSSSLQIFDFEIY